MTKTNDTKAPFSKGEVLYVTRSGFPEHAIGSRIVVASVVNAGTKRNPAWRFYGNGLWFYAEDVSRANPLA